MDFCIHLIVLLNRSHCKWRNHYFKKVNKGGCTFLQIFNRKTLLTPKEEKSKILLQKPHICSPFGSFCPSPGGSSCRGQPRFELAVARTHVLWVSSGNTLTTWETKTTGAVWLWAEHPSGVCHKKGNPKCCLSHSCPRDSAAVVARTLAQQHLNQGLLLPSPECCCLETPGAAGWDGMGPQGSPSSSTPPQPSAGISLRFPCLAGLVGALCPSASTSLGELCFSSAPATSFFLSLPPFVT